MKRNLLVVGVACFCCAFFGMQTAFSQTSEDLEPWTDSNIVEYNKWYLGAMFGTYQFYGDLVEEGFSPISGKEGEVNWMFGLRAGREFNQQFGSRVNFTMGKMYSEKNGLWFDADVRDFSLDFTVNMTNVLAPYRYNKRWNATAYVGVGFLAYRSIGYDANNNDSVFNSVGYDSDGNKDKMKMAPSINFGALVAYKLSERVDAFFEIGYSALPIDDLDAKEVHLSDKDMYSRACLGIHYTFGSSDQAYKWNPKSPYLEALESDIVDMGNDVNEAVQCCEENRVNECDTSTVDTDKDQIPDCRDLELNTPQGSIVNFQGVAIISPDSVTGDMTLAQGAKAKSDAPVRKSPSIFFSPVYFEYDKTVIDSTGEFNLVNVALYMKQYPDVRILISGNTDEHGSDNYNDGLSKRRCEKVKNILVKEYGIDENRFDVQPNGKKYLLFPKKDHANRRVDFSVVE